MVERKYNHLKYYIAHYENYKDMFHNVVEYMIMGIDHYTEKKLSQNVLLIIWIICYEIFGIFSWWHGTKNWSSISIFDEWEKVIKQGNTISLCVPILIHHFPINIMLLQIPIDHCPNY